MSRIGLGDPSQEESAIIQPADSKIKEFTMARLGGEAENSDVRHVLSNIDKQISIEPKTQTRKESYNKTVHNSISSKDQEGSTNSQNFIDLNVCAKSKRPR